MRNEFYTFITNFPLTHAYTYQSVSPQNISNFMMADAIIGCFKHVKSENFEEYLEAMDLPLPARKMMSSVDPIVGFQPYIHICHLRNSNRYRFKNELKFINGVLQRHY